MKLLIFIVGTLLVSAFAGPVREKREEDDSTLNDILEGIKMLKDPDTYEAIKDFSEMFKTFGDLGDLLDSDVMDEDDKHNLELAKKLFGRFEEGLKVLFELAKITLVEGAKPNEQQLVDLAKRFSKVMRESTLSIRNYGIKEHTLMSNETIEQIKEIVISTPLKVSGNNYLDQLKEKLPKIHIVAERFRKVNRHIKQAIKDNERIKLPDQSKPNEKVMSRFMFEFIFDELVNLMKSEETAVVLFKNFGVLADTIKSSSSYENLQAFYNGLAKSKRLESHAILVREVGKCLGAELNDEERGTWRQHFAKALQIAKVMLADGEDTSKADGLIKDFKENDLPVLARLFNKMTDYEKTPEGRKRLRGCLVTDQDRSLYLEALKIENPVFNDDHLKAIREKNEKVYAFLQLLNSGLKALRRREGLGEEADAYFKEVVTMRGMMLGWSEMFNPSQTTIDQLEEFKKMATDKYNALSSHSKKQIVDVFPYRTVMNFGIMD